MNYNTENMKISNKQYNELSHQMNESDVMNPQKRINELTK